MKVLIAEDDAVSRRLLKSCLEKWGHEVTEAVDGADALGRFGEGEFPIVIADWMMPEMDGPELIRKIRAKQLTRYVYIILLTAKSQKEDLIEGMQSGADDFVTKPFDRDELQVRLSAGERVLRLEHTLAEQNRALREAQAALIQTEKFASIGQLAMGVAGEISTPVTQLGETLLDLRRELLAASDLLATYREARGCLAGTQYAARIAEQEAESDGALSGHLAAKMERCLFDVRRVRDMVRNLRDFAHLDEYLVKEFSINSAIEDVLTMVERDALKKQVEVKPRLENLPQIQGNPGKIKKAMLNLLSYGISSASRDGIVEVRTKPWADNEVPDRGVLIEFQDDGPGITAEDQKHLFEPFYPLRLNDSRGNGLELSISLNIIREHGGTIDLSSVVGHGTTFRVYIPRQSKAQVNV